MKDSELVWSSESGDMRKKNKKNNSQDEAVNEGDLLLHTRRLTSGKGRTIIEISNLPQNKKWCQKLAKELKKSLGVGGAYKNEMIEIHTKEYEKIEKFFLNKSITIKKIGG